MPKIKLNNIPITIDKIDKNHCQILIEASPELEKNYAKCGELVIPKYIRGFKVTNVKILGNLKNPIHIKDIKIEVSNALIDIIGQEDPLQSGDYSVEIGNIYGDGKGNHITLDNIYIQYINPVPYQNFYTLNNVGSAINPAILNGKGKPMLPCKLFMNKSGLSEIYVYPSEFYQEANTTDIMFRYFKNIYFMGAKDNKLKLYRLNIYSDNRNIIIRNVKLDGVYNDGSNNNIYILNSQCNTYKSSNFVEKLNINNSTVKNIYSSYHQWNTIQKDTINIYNSEVGDIEARNSDICIYDTSVDIINLSGEDTDITLYDSKINALYSSNYKNLNKKASLNREQHLIYIFNGKEESKKIKLFNSSLKMVLFRDSLDIFSNINLKDIEFFKLVFKQVDLNNTPEGQNMEFSQADAVLRKYDPKSYPAFPYRVIADFSRY